MIDLPVNTFPSGDLDRPCTLPGGATITLREVFAACEELDCRSEDEASGAVLAWASMRHAESIIPDFTAPTFIEVLRASMRATKRTIQ